ncbi:2-aminomuconic semialdehyde dehydrogenase-like [Patiria miniata]|uniref:2-aminomuconic semialdehyde dehydrogenase n=1 Tax=Patiria miniata TaxID=46514 RepID=A0A913ZLB4_PATMI|nr:2-aminomuconic semialdehyde dehydrogenase-like [Patiria miniata]XP_038051836.1 2-aminomuconic semialdehyde dehydrogenase-like [Patiria miniata]
MAEIVVENFIGGEFLRTESYLDSYDPSTGEVWARIPDSGEAEIERAVQAAKSAFPGWSSTPAEERSRIMQRIADIVESRLQEFAEAESRDQGKPVSLATRVDIPRLMHNFRFFSTSILHMTNSSTLLDKAGAVNYTTQTPVGVAGLISPWNLPVYLLSFKIAPCIAFGNTCICKPSEMTSVTAWMLAKVFNDAGVPPGVINIVFGTGPRAGQALVKHPDVPLISFTGGTATAEHIIKTSAPFCKKLSLELGGKNPGVVFEDADFENCVQTCVRSSFANQGEICLCTSRIFVQDTIFDKFVERFVQETRKLKVGPPQEASSNLGALISKEHLQKVKGYVAIASQDGGTVLCGQEKETLELPEKNKNGYFMRPTVIVNVPDDTRSMQEEIFGPVTCINSFKSEEEAIQRANNVKFGLSACLWTQDVSRAHRVGQKLQAGTVWTNCWLVRDLNLPFGGTKASGIGREGATSSREFFTEEKTICIKL